LKAGGTFVYQNNHKKLQRSPKRKDSEKDEKIDALEEYLHLTASAVKINYPTVDASIKELLDMTRNVQFYEAYNHLDNYMRSKLEMAANQSMNKNDVDTAQPQKGTVTKQFGRLKQFGSSVVADILFNKTPNTKDKDSMNKIKGRVRRSQSVQSMHGYDRKKMKRKEKKLKSRVNGKNGTDKYEKKEMIKDKKEKKEKMKKNKKEKKEKKDKEKKEKKEKKVRKLKSSNKISPIKEEMQSLENNGSKEVKKKKKRKSKIKMDAQKAAWFSFSSDKKEKKKSKKPSSELKDDGNSKDDQMIIID